MNSDRLHEGGIGNHSGHLGRWYQTHLSGRIASVCFSTRPAETIYNHERDAQGVYVRRRFSLTASTMRRERLLNTVGWLVNPDLADPSVRSPVLSFAYLALTSPLGPKFAPEAIRASLVGDLSPHLRARHVLNVLRGFPAATAFAANFGVRRFLLRRKVPGFFVRSETNVYPVHYHAEQVPLFESRVYLGNERDEVGARRLCLDLRFSRYDFDSVVRSHQLWDNCLRARGVGRLEYASEDLPAAVEAQASGGAHQIGTTRMARLPADGVVGPDLSVHGFSDLFVLSSSSFPTSSQANSTFMIVTCAVRLADHLRARL
jgi:hypothetical protein